LPLTFCRGLDVVCNRFRIDVDSLPSTLFLPPKPFPLSLAILLLVTLFLTAFLRLRKIMPLELIQQSPPNGPPRSFEIASWLLGSEPARVLVTLCDGFQSIPPLSANQYIFRTAFSTSPRQPPFCVQVTIFPNLKIRRSSSFRLLSEALLPLPASPPWRHQKYLPESCFAAIVFVFQSESRIFPLKLFPSGTSSIRAETRRLSLAHSLSSEPIPPNTLFRYVIETLNYPLIDLKVGNLRDKPAIHGLMGIPFLSELPVKPVS